MAIDLEGGVRVADLREGRSRELGPLRVYRRFGRASGAAHVSLRILELDPGQVAELANRSCEEVLYVLEGRGAAIRDGERVALAPDTGVYLAPGASLELENAGTERLVLASSRCPEPLEDEDAPPGGAAPGGRRRVPAITRLSERRRETTADRWYCVMLDGEVGERNVTQFVGSIPPGRAPDHFHHYEEVLVVLRGAGRLWAGATSAPIAAGSCIYLPRGQVHCVENAAPAELRLLGVFYPAGSPAVSYATPD